MSRHSASRSPALGGKKKQDPGQAPCLGGDAALAHILTALQDIEPAVRERALDALETIGTERALALLIQSTRDPHTSVRRRAFAVLARLQGETAATTLRAGLADADEAIRHSAVAGLGRQRDPQDVDALLHILRRDESGPVRAQAALALAEIGDPRVTFDLTRAVSDVFNYRIWRPIARALRRLYEQHPQTVSSALLLQLLDAEVRRMWSPLTPVFEIVKPVEALPALIDVVRNTGQDPMLRHAVIYALAAIRSPDAAPALLEVARNEQDAADIRARATRLVGKLPSPDVAPALLEVLLAGGPFARWAAEGLGYNRDPEAVPALLRLLAHDDWKIQRYAVGILHARKVREAVPGIEGCLSHPRAEVREMAVLALSGRFRQPEILPRLIEILRWDKSAKVRLTAIKGLAKFDAVQAAEALVAALDDPVLTVRQRASSALFRLCTTDPVRLAALRDRLLPFVDDPDSSIRWYVSQMMQRLPPG